MAAMSTIAMIGAGLAAGTVVSGALTKKPKTPDMPDPKVERAKAEADAALASNSKLAAKNRSRRASSLLAKDAAPDALGAGPQAGKDLLGQ